MPIVLVTGDTERQGSVDSDPAANPVLNNYQLLLNNNIDKITINIILKEGKNNQSSPNFGKNKF